CTTSDTVFAGDHSEPCDTGTQSSVVSSRTDSVAINGTLSIDTNIPGLTDISCNQAASTCASATCSQRTANCCNSAAADCADICEVSNPKVSISKQCDASGNVTVTVTNTSQPPEDLTGCQVTDELFVDNSTCGAVGTGTAETLTLQSGSLSPLAKGASAVF